MPALVIFCLQSVKDPAALARYRSVGMGTLDKYGAQFLGGPSIVKTLEGEPLQGAVVLKFDTIEAAQAWYESDEYRAVVGIRLDATTGNAFIVETR